MKKLIASLAVLGSACVFAGIDDTSVIISTKGPDTYADGTQVLDGECYALCWSAGEFGGIKADCTPVNEEDRILGVFPSAKDGKCRLFKYTLTKDQFDEGGNITLWLLDTRVYSQHEGVTETGLAQQVAKDKVTTVNAANQVKAAVAVQSAGVGGISGSDPVRVVAGTQLPAGIPPARVKGIKVGDVWVEIEVENTASCVTYGVQAGDSPSGLKKVEGAAVTGRDGGVITIYTEKKGDAGFFKVDRR